MSNYYISTTEELIRLYSDPIMSNSTNTHFETDTRLHYNSNFIKYNDLYFILKDIDKMLEIGIK